MPENIYRKKEKMETKRSLMLSEEKRVARQRAKERYAENREQQILRVYRRLLDAGKIRCPRATTIEKYGLLKLDGRWRVPRPMGSEKLRERKHATFD